MSSNILTCRFHAVCAALFCSPPLVNRWELMFFRVTFRENIPIEICLLRFQNLYIVILNIFNHKTMQLLGLRVPFLFMYFLHGYK